MTYYRHTQLDQTSFVFPSFLRAQWAPESTSLFSCSSCLRVEVFFFSLCILLIIAAAGCSGPNTVNARLVGDWPHLEDSLGKDQADIVLVAQREELRPYSESETFGRGEGWFFATWSVQRVEQSQWKDETLRFIFREPAYDVELDTAEYLGPAPYRRHPSMRFWLRRGWGPPTIVAQEPVTRP